MSDRLFISDKYNITLWKSEYGYSVSMPHQCDSWRITDDSVPIAEAIKDLKQFIAEANTALTMLYGEDVGDQR